MRGSRRRSRRILVGATCLAMKRAMDQGPPGEPGVFGNPNPKQKPIFSRLPIKTTWRKAGWFGGWPADEKTSLSPSGPGQGGHAFPGRGHGFASRQSQFRDRGMHQLAQKFPAYDFGSYKGYGSPKHLKALKAHGPTTHHRPKFLVTFWATIPRVDPMTNGAEVEFHLKDRYDPSVYDFTRSQCRSCRHPEAGPLPG